MFFGRSPAWDAVDYWALDLETGGLDPRRDAILSVGMLPVRRGILRLGEAYQTLVRPAEGLRVDPGSIRAHELLGGEVAEGRPVGEVLPEIARRLGGGGVLLVHNRGFDEAFLRRDFKREGLHWPRPPVVDTMDLLVRVGRFLHPEMSSDMQPLNLTRARRHYGLPNYGAHDALIDAIATAELFLVLRRVLGARTLRDLR